MTLRFIQVIRLFFISLAVSAMPGLSDGCKKAYDLILQLRFGEAQTILREEKETDPESIFPYYLENYKDFLELLITEDLNSHDRYKSEFENRIEFVKSSERNSPYYLFILSEMYLQSSFVNIKFNDNWKALFLFYTSYKYTQKNRERYPEFESNNKLAGVLNVILGMVPQNFNWIMKVAGMKGDVSLGIQQLERYYKFTRQSEFPEIEAAIILAFTYLQTNNREPSALEFLQSLSPVPFENSLFRFTYALSLNKAGKNYRVIPLLEDYRQPENEIPFLFLDFLYGEAKLNRLDKDANIPLEKFAAEFKGMHYIKTCWHKLGWYYLLNGEEEKYQKCLHMVEKAGKMLVDADKQAIYEASSGRKPNLVLLKARLLFDGGYFGMAGTLLLENHDPDLFETGLDKLEYLYRLARVYHMSGEKMKAEKYYQIVLDKGREVPAYFASNSALQLGRVYEENDKPGEAVDYYKLALQLSRGSYWNSIVLEARSALNRLE
ncbi:MAG: hypothetical protein JSV24_07135 [Bacteroidales bacterium]|nr:MAG: hypothetical protein JSV24_07135 [Bacteroidales bacterium]